MITDKVVCIKNIRNTKQRELILKIINNSCEHLNAEAVYDLSRKHIKNISLGTVYRNLNQLVDLGLVRRIKMDNGIDRFDNTIQNHSHFICTECNNIIDIFDSIMFEENLKNMKVISYDIKLTGICEVCMRKEKKNGKRK